MQTSENDLHRKSAVHWHAYDDPGEDLQLAYVAGDKTSELEFKDMVVRVTLQDSAKATVCDVLYCPHALSLTRAI